MFWHLSNQSQSVLETRILDTDLAPSSIFVALSPVDDPILYIPQSCGSPFDVSASGLFGSAYGSIPFRFTPSPVVCKYVPFVLHCVPHVA